MIAHEMGFKFHAQPQTGAYSCAVGISRFQFWLILQICKVAIELTSRQDSGGPYRQIIFSK